MVIELSCNNHTTGDFCSCITGRLGVEIIRIAVNDHCPSDDIAYPEAVGSHFQMSVPLLHHQGWKIPGVPGMIGLTRIVMAASLQKSCTVAALSFMDMKAEEPCFTALRKPGYICHHQHTAGFLIEPNLTIDIGCVRSASDKSHCARTARVSNHEITSLQAMP